MSKIRGTRVNLFLLTWGRSRRLLLCKDFRDKAVVTKAKVRVDHLQVADISGLIANQGKGHVTIAISLDCDAPFPGGPLTTRQPAEYSWMSGNPTPLMKIGQCLFCMGNSTQGTKPVSTINNDHIGSMCE